MRAPPLPIAPGVELRIHGQLQVVRSVSDVGEVELECPIRRTRVSLAMSEVVAMRMAGTLEPVHTLPVTHVVSGTPNRGLLNPAMHERIARRMAYGKAAAQLYPVGPKSPRLRRLIDEVAERTGDSRPPSPHAVYRWVRRYVTSGYDTAVFMQDADVTRMRRPRKLTDNTRGRLLEHIQVLLGAYKGATLYGITNMALAKTAKELDYIQFQTKEGVHELVDEYIAREHTRLTELAERKAASAGARHPKPKEMP